MSSGLALDSTSTDVEVPHPAGAEVGFMAPMVLVFDVNNFQCHKSSFHSKDVIA